MPGILVAHKTLLQSSFFEVSDEISVSSATLLRATSTSTRPARGIVDARHAPVGRRRVVGWAWLQSNWLGRVEVACYALDGSGNAALLLLHGRGPLARRSHPRLGIEAGLLGHIAVLPRRHLLWGLGHDHLAVSTLLSSVWWRLRYVRASGGIHIAAGATIVVAVDRRNLGMSWLLVLSSHRRVSSLRGRVGLRLRCLRPLLAQRFSLLLLLRARGGRPIQ